MPPSKNSQNIGLKDKYKTETKMGCNKTWHAPMPKPARSPYTQFFDFLYTRNQKIECMYCAQATMPWLGFKAKERRVLLLFTKTVLRVV